MTEMYQQIFNQAPIPVLIVDVEGHILNFNNQYLSDFFPAETESAAYIGQNMLSVAAIGEAGLKDAYDRILHQDVQQIERHLVTGMNDGVGRYFSIRVQAWREDENIKGYVLFHFDTTSICESDTELDKRQQQLEELQEVAGLGSWDLHIPSGQAFWSKQEYRLLAYDPEKDQASAEKFMARVHVDDRERAQAALNKSLQDRTPYQAEFRLIMPDGKVRHVAERGRVIYNSEGQPERFVGTTWDITEQKEAQRRLLASQEELSKILENMQDTYYRTDLEGRVVRVSHSVFDLLGYRPEEVLGTRIIDLYVDANERQRLFQALEENGGKVQGFEAMLKCKDDSTIWVSTNAQYYEQSGEIQGVEGTTRNITTLKKIEEELYKHQRHLERLVEERTKELEAFSYSVSHDLRAPLRSINGFSQALQEDYGDILDDTAKHYLQRVCNATHRMGDLIDDLLQFSRVNRCEIENEDVDLSAMVKGVLYELEQNEPDRRVEVIIKPGLVVNGDTRLLHIAMQNLLENAWKYTSQEPVAKIEFGLLEDGTFYLQDNGVGFNMDYVDKLFKPFQRLHSHEEFQGTGIGLAIVYRIIARHGGKVWGESTLGKGSSFYFRFKTDVSHIA